MKKDFLEEIYEISQIKSRILHRRNVLDFRENIVDFRLTEEM